jgi:UrcA family protein
MISRLTTTLCAFALLVTLSYSVPGIAQSPKAVAATPSSIVRYEDLDLSDAAGIHTLYGRIQHAAWLVCGQIVPAQNGPSGIENVHCRQTLVDAAVAEVNRPALTALHTHKKPSERTASRPSPFAAVAVGTAGAVDPPVPR